MKKQWVIGLFLISLIGILGVYDRLNYQPLMLSSDLAQRIGLQIWHNECMGKEEGLTCWNQGEDFASLGIGHFIWYPEGKTGHFKETFPDLLILFKSHGVQLPAWLELAKGCPWQTREEFQQDQQGERLKELRQLLARHVDLQLLFMVRRLQKALSTILKHVPKSQHSHLTFQFYRLAHDDSGLYTLLDYLNFKGEGIASQESYQGQGWGLLQVLERLQGIDPGQPAIEEFIEVAKAVLALRVEHAPPERREQRWLKGWYNRLDTYQFFNK